MDVRSSLVLLPKVELHVHLDGAIPAWTLHSLLRAQHAKDPSLTHIPEQVPLPWLETPLPVRKKLLEVVLEDSSDTSALQLKALCCCKGQRSLHAMLERFYTFLPVVAGSFSAIVELSKQFVRSQGQQHVLYTEVRFSPQLLAEASGARVPLSSDGVVEAVATGIRLGCEEVNAERVGRSPIVVTIILCCISGNPEWSDDVVRLAVKYAVPVEAKVLTDVVGCVVGVDIASGEGHFSPESPSHLLHKAAMKRAHEEGIPITLHAGEVTSRREVVRAVVEWKASRIGHGYRVMDTTEEQLASDDELKHVLFELCPQSSFETGGWIGAASEAEDWTGHPIISMLDRFVCNINSDDPEVFGSDLVSEYCRLCSDMHVDVERLVKANADALVHAFVPARFRALLSVALEVELKLWRAGSM
mmetsp:Transcript_31110/g.82798  ORF Transcript_31110/g.82798 Transcript_31110/m.82798 type:complete len:416 (-) Transcript_31110:37-1284(-)